MAVMSSANSWTSRRSRRPGGGLNERLHFENRDIATKPFAAAFDVVVITFLAGICHLAWARRE
jgi:hypothetical protein